MVCPRDMPTLAVMVTDMAMVMDMVTTVKLPCLEPAVVTWVSPV